MRAGTNAVLLLVAGLFACSATAEEEPIGSDQLGITVSQPANADVTIREGSSNQGTWGQCDVAGDQGTLVGRTCLVRFAVPTINDRITVTSAELSLTVINATSQSYPLVHPLQVSFVEWYATWVLRAPRAAWELPGAKGSLDRNGFVMAEILAPPLGALTVPLNVNGRTVVRNWVQCPNLNNGLAIASNAISADAFTIASRESADLSIRPKLKYTYTVGSGPLPDCSRLGPFVLP